MKKEFKDYVPDIKFINEICKHFDGDLNTDDFSANSDFETYLCALAYGCIGHELFLDAKITLKLDNALRNDVEFMQGMATYSILQKINKANSIIDSSEFQQSMKIDFSKEDKENDYATIAFIMYYLTTKGYKVEWNKMSHAYSPINLSNGPVSFVRDRILDPEELLDNVQQDLNKEKSL